MILKQIHMTDALNISKKRGISYQQRQALTPSGIYSTKKHTSRVSQVIIVGATCIVTRITYWGKVLKRKGPVVAGLFFDIAKMSFATLDNSNKSRIAQLSVNFQQSSSLNIKLNEVVHV